MVVLGVVLEERLSLPKVTRAPHAYAPRSSTCRDQSVGYLILSYFKLRDASISCCHSCHSTSILSFFIQTWNTSGAEPELSTA